MTDDYQPHYVTYVTTPAPAFSLDGSLIGKEVFVEGAWWGVTGVHHERGKVTIHVWRMEADIGEPVYRYAFLKRGDTVKYRNRQT